MKKILTIVIVLTTLATCQKPQNPEKGNSYKAGASATGSYICSNQSELGRVDGSQFWPDSAVVVFQKSNCALNQLMMNNFLYLVGDDSQGHPRFMSYAPWYQMFPATGEPTWTGSYAPLSYTHLTMDASQEQAGNDFKLLDVNSATTSYDLRVNQPFFDYVKSNQLYTQQGLQTAQTAYNNNDKTGGIWLPPTDENQKGVSSVEFKTSWRFYGPATKKLCPEAIMHCEIDDQGNSWGLVGFHLVQKTVTHGEFVWGSFEHVGNSPDCRPGNGNPIALNPVDPVNPNQTINLNQNIPGLKDRTGWNYFDFTGYKAAKGDGSTCPIPTTVSQNALCMKNPQNNNSWVQVNICRTEALPVPSDQNCTGAGGDENLLPSACLNRSVRENFPSGLANKWKYYQLIGMEWMSNLGSYSNGAKLQGCFPFEDGYGNINNCPSSKYSPIGGFQAIGTKHLANSTMETWMQSGIYLNRGSGKDPVVATDCFGCHQPPTASYKGKLYQGDFSHIFNRVTRDK